MYKQTKELILKLQKFFEKKSVLHIIFEKST